MVLCSCGDFMDVQTIRPKYKEAEGSGEEGSVGGGFAGMGFQKPPETDGIAVGKAPTEAMGYLPTNVKAGEVKIQGYTLPSDSDIVWSDEDDPTADIAFDKAFTHVVKPKSLWYDSYGEAKREAMRTGKPMLIWFTQTGDSPSPLCKTLSREVFARSDFKSWAKEKVIRLKIDLAGKKGARGENGEIMNDEARSREYAARMKKKYRVLGLPAVVMESPSKGVLAQYRGYKKGSAGEYWWKMKNVVLTHEHNHSVWKKGMAAKGYREWTGSNGQVVFAKLARYQKGRLLLVEPDGKRLQTTEANLSKVDRAWIAAAKKARGL